MQKKYQDKEFVEQIIEKVEEEKAGFVVTDNEGWSFFLPNKNVTPKQGDTIRYYGKGFGYPVRGVDINGEEVFYMSVDEWNEKRLREVEERNRARQEKFEANKESYFQRIHRLPHEFQLRFERFRLNRPDFDVEFGDYELFCCEQGFLIGASLISGESIETFMKLDFNEQKKLVPDLSEEHSGNTFGKACELAYWYRTDILNVVRTHGALCGLVGCESYGCHPMHEVWKSETDR